MIRWKRLPEEYKNLEPVLVKLFRRKGCKVFPKGMGSFVRELTVNKEGKYAGVDRALRAGRSY